MKRKKLFIITVIALFILKVTYGFSICFLKKNQLTFMNDVKIIFAAVLSVLSILLLTQIFFFLYRAVKNKKFKKTFRVASVFGIIIVLGFLITASIYGSMLAAFSYRPEHVVEKGGIKMVASVNSFLQVNVDYYDYKNSFVRGDRIKIKEDYGNGGYDPFEQEKMPTLRRFIYYDHNGKVIKSNW